jgi:hypothetical protein
MHLPYTSTALQNLKPGATWELRNEDYNTLIWTDREQEKPTKAEVEAEARRIKAEWDALEYQRQRAPEYPPIGDQLDALWKGGDAAAEMLARVQAIKAQYPKPEEV